MEAAPEGLDLAEVRDHILDVPGVVGVHDLHAWTITSGAPMLSTHVVVDDQQVQSGRGGDVLDELQSCLEADFAVTHTTFQIEPTAHTSHEVGGMRRERSTRVITYLSGLSSGFLLATLLVFRSRVIGFALQPFRRNKRIVIRLEPLTGAIEDAAARQDADLLEASFRPAFQQVVDAVARDMVSAIERNPRSQTEDIRRYRAGFEKRLMAGWEPALSLFDLIRVFALDIGSDVNTRYRPLAAARQDHISKR